DQPNNSGSTRAIAKARTWLGLASANDNSPVSAANAQPRSGSVVVAKYSRIRRNLPLRDGVNSNEAINSANRFNCRLTSGYSIGLTCSLTRQPGTKPTRFCSVAEPGNAYR